MYKKYAELRDKRNITDYRVAADTGISTATLSNWKNGNYAPKFDKLLILANTSTFRWSISRRLNRTKRETYSNE